MILPAERRETSVDREQLGQTYAIKRQDNGYTKCKNDKCIDLDLVNCAEFESLTF
jgi:hypothetical protein